MSHKLNVVGHENSVCMIIHQQKRIWNSETRNTQERLTEHTWNSWEHHHTTVGREHDLSFWQTLLCSRVGDHVFWWAENHLSKSWAHQTWLLQKNKLIFILVNVMISSEKNPRKPVSILTEENKNFKLPVTDSKQNHQSSHSVTYVTWSEPQRNNQKTWLQSSLMRLTVFPSGKGFSALLMQKSASKGFHALTHSCPSHITYPPTPCSCWSLFTDECQSQGCISFTVLPECNENHGFYYLCLPYW